MSRQPGLVPRLLAAQLLVIAAGTVTVVLVALAAGPALFRYHIRQALGTVPASVQGHLDEAFTAATGISLGVSVAAALITATGVSLFITRRLSRPIRALGAAATRVAGGDYSAQVHPAGLGGELDTLTSAFNTMATALEATEATRRRLLSDAAHELRTPLATLSAFVEGLADGVREPTQQTWDIMTAQTLRLRRLADDLALVSRAEEGQLPLRPVPIAPGQVVKAAIAGARPGFTAKDVDLTGHVTAELPRIVADPDRMGQVLAGLLANALRHTPPGGHVTVIASREGPAVRITVTDTGDGIAPEHLPHLFERFYRAEPGRDRAHGGSGIGLTIARALITAQDGTITAASDGPGAGARFTITLPAARL